MRPALALTILLLALPTVGAGWRSHGQWEPDTTWDTPLEMWPGPDAAPTGAGKVYFQAFQALPETAVNPNVGALGTRVLAAPAAHHRAVLGVWKDCNRDGYVGLAEGAVQDYRAELLLDRSVCPPGTTHNDGRWVNEMVHVGMVDPCEYEADAVREAACPGVDAFAPNERVLYANGTYVWGDLGAPGDVPAAECILLPLPRGATSGSGALLGTLDCQSQRGLAHAVNMLDPDGALGLRFDDPARPEDSTSLLNQPFPVTPFGTPGRAGLLQDDAEQASFTAWDCGASPVLDLRDPQGPRDVALADPTGDKLSAETFPWVIAHALTGVGFEDEDADPSTPGVLRVPLTDEEGRYARVPAPAPSLDDPTASWWLALERAADGPAGDCDDGTPSPLAPYYVGGAVEGDAAPVYEARKDRPSLTFVFYDGHRGVSPHVDPHLGATAPSDGGLVAFDHGRGGDGPLWSALAPTEQDPQLVGRADLQPAPARFFTYYAYVGPAVTASGALLPNPTPRAYGAANCGGATSGVHAGWVCDAALWWKDAHGEDNRPRYAQGAPIGRVVGDLYHMRDVDCHDGAVARGSGVHASLVDASEEGACPEPDGILGGA